MADWTKIMLSFIYDGKYTGGLTLWVVMCFVVTIGVYLLIRDRIKRNYGALWLMRRKTTKVGKKIGVVLDVPRAENIKELIKLSEVMEKSLSMGVEKLDSIDKQTPRRE